MIVHQSQLSSYNRCPEAHRRELNGQRGKALSATSYGSVIHHALHVLERTGDTQLAVNTFDHYWHPLNIEAIAEPVEEWIARDSYGALRTKGMELLRRYGDLMRFREDEELLALEYPFVVPIAGTWDPDLEQPHLLAGTVDRLAIRIVRGKEVLNIDDWKSGRKKTYLRLALQFTGYSQASTQPTFWTGDPEHYTDGFGPERGQRLHARLVDAERHGWWIDCSGTTPKWTDAGPRIERDYARFTHTVEQYVKARRYEVFPLNYEGEVCTYCPFNADCPEGIDQ